MSHLPAAAHQLASQALGAAVANDWTAAATAVRTIYAEHPDDILNIMVAWIDTLIGRCYPEVVGDPQLIHIHLRAEETGQIGGEVRPAITWATKLIAARAAMDENEFRAAIREAPTDKTECGRWVGELLGVVAASLRLHAATTTAGG